MPAYTQEEFDSELREMLREAQNMGQQFRRVISGRLHERVVGGAQPNRMPMACEAMWKLWREQGSHKERIYRTTDSGQSTTIEIEFGVGSK